MTVHDLLVEWDEQTDRGPKQWNTANTHTGGKDTEAATQCLKDRPRSSSPVRLDAGRRVLLDELFALFDVLLQLRQTLLDGVHLLVQQLAESQYLLNTLFLHTHTPPTTVVGVKGFDGHSLTKCSRPRSTLWTCMIYRRWHYRTAAAGPPYNVTVKCSSRNETTDEAARTRGGRVLSPSCSHRKSTIADRCAASRWNQQSRCVCRAELSSWRTAECWTDAFAQVNMWIMNKNVLLFGCESHRLQ